MPLFSEKGIDVSVLRLDKLHPVVSGNKWFKLRYYLEEAVQHQKETIVTYGGAWSNHIVATAAACRQLGLKSYGIIRGEEPANWSPTLLQAQKYGMQLLFISREDYKNKIVPPFLQQAHCYFIAEGGYGVKGVQGAATIPGYATAHPYTHICCAAGTGTMTAGLLSAASAGTHITSISVLRNNHSLENDIRSLTAGAGKLTVMHDYHFGGYARHTPALISFMNSFYTETKIPTDFVYTAKLSFAVNDLTEQGYFHAGSRLLLIHSGGLQGNASLDKGTLIF